MNAIDERLDRAAEGAGLETILPLENPGPLHRSGGVVHVPDPDIGVFQREPHPLFGRPQRFHRVMPFGDVGAGAERAGHVSGLVSRHRTAPFDQPFGARAGENRVHRM
jgi:hypothetical protein